MGSNVGDRLAYLRQARARVLALPGVSGAEDRCAPIYETDPVDCPPGSGAFLNTVMEIDTPDALPPLDLLAALRKIEGTLGRPSRYPRNAPRPVDLDILYAGNLVLDHPVLTLPHPRLLSRRFVLEPLAALRPELILPGQDKPVAALVHESGDPGTVSLIASKW